MLGAEINVGRINIVLPTLISVTFYLLLEAVSAAVSNSDKNWSGVLSPAVNS